MSYEISSKSRRTWNFSMQCEITFDLIYSFTGLEIAVWDEPLCSLSGFFWTRLSLLAKLYLCAMMISLMDYSAKVGLSGSSLIEFELSWLKRSQSSMFSKLMSWIINLVVFWSFSMVMVFCLYLSSFIFATSLMSMFLSPFYWACSWALSNWFCLLEMLSIICWLAISLSTPCKIR